MFTRQNGKRPVLSDDVDLEELAAKTDGYTGADLAGLVKQASMFSLRQSLNIGNTKVEDLCVNKQHFEEALKQLRPSVSEQVRQDLSVNIIAILINDYCRIAKFTRSCAKNMPRHEYPSSRPSENLCCRTSI